MLPHMPNRLLNEPSLYLQQHAHNPVDWWPWCPEAFAEAQRREVPVLVSIGYSACHWCHVMERESFEDAYIAGLMNEHFVCIKVDREERPDLDQLYMEAVMMLHGHGGWPLNVFCLPDQRPFFGGTYFPPADNGRGMMPWPQLLMRISEHYRRDRHDLEQNAAAIIGNMEHGNRPQGENTGNWRPQLLVAAAEAICGQADATWGGFGQAPKFPQPMTLDFLLALRATGAAAGRKQLCEDLDYAVNRSLTAMARGGLYDQVGGGFCRYSVDEQWLIPHFEKMLYDNGQLLGVYAKAWRRYREPLYEAVVAETVAWLEREMVNEVGLYSASLDADTPEGEGRFYCWTPEGVAEVLGKEQAEGFCKAYFITQDGNFEEGLSNPALALGNFEERQQWVQAREKLRVAREQRERPGRDPKALLSWNALAICGLAEAAFSFERRDWLQRAFELYGLLESNLRRPDGRWCSTFYPQGAARHLACLDDYALLLEATLTLSAYGDLLAVGKGQEFEQRARLLAEAIESLFADEDPTGYFHVGKDHEALPVRKKEWIDHAMPGGMSSLLHSYAALYVLTGEERYARVLDSLRPIYPPLMQRAPTAVAHALSALTQDATGLAVIKAPGTGALPELAGALVGRPWRRLFLRVDESLKGYQLCVGTQCLAPEASAHEIAERISD